jgi:hypothetical protein
MLGLAVQLAPDAVACRGGASRRCKLQPNDLATVATFSQRMTQACKGGQFDACNAQADVTLASGQRREAETAYKRGLELAARRQRRCAAKPSEDAERCAAADAAKDHAQAQLDEIAELWRTGH